MNDMVKDWVKEAANEICSDNSLDNPTPERMREIIQRHCPFKPRVLYEEVTETSRKLDQIVKRTDEIYENVRYIRSQR